MNNANNPTKLSTRAWRKARVAARLICRHRTTGQLSRRDAFWASWLAADESVTHRLLDQALSSLQAHSRQ